MKRFATVRILALAVLFTAAGCMDSSGPDAVKRVGAPIGADSLPSLIVSGPVLGLDVGSVTVSPPRSLGRDSVAYVSLPQGSVPAGTVATIRDLASGLVATTSVRDGGFDPVAIAAKSGDTVAVEITRPGSGPVHGWQLVRPRPLVVVRTDPPPRKLDVPVNSIMVVVFSEPITSATLNAGSIQLLRATVPVAGSVQLGDTIGLTAEVHPDSPLAGRTVYQLVVTQAVHDVSGGALASPIAIEFTTEDASITPPPVRPLVFASVSVGASHSCGVTTGSAAYCWGYNFAGQLGNGTTASSSTPVAVAGGLEFKTVSAGYLHTCGVTTAGLAYCWGASNYGALGIDQATLSDCGPEYCATPQAVAGGYTFAQVSAGSFTTCGVTVTGAAYCWGDDTYGELGADSTTLTRVCGLGRFAGCLVPMPVSGGLTFVSVSVGNHVTCGVTTNGAAFCWGDNSVGALGAGTSSGPQQCQGASQTDSTVACSFTPVAVAGGLTFKAVNAASGSACGVTTTGAAYCWGANERGELGLGTTSGPQMCLEFVSCSPTPAPVVSSLAFTSLTAGTFDVCGITTTGAAYCWGANREGSLGNGTTTPSATPVLVSGGLTFAAVSVPQSQFDSGHACGVTTGSLVYCWGLNGHGQLGTGSTIGSTVPVRVAGQQ